MAFWLARERDGQHSDFVQRFDPRFWTVDFPRPMMASVVTTAPDTLRVELEFHHRDALAGLIWWSEDTLDHPLLAYDTNRDYSRTTLRFRWRSSGVRALDAVHGPTLTIEGRDRDGNARTWYVRLWNYATGTPEDAVVSLPFSTLLGGWDLQLAPDPVYPADIDRMFVSLAPPDYDPTDHGLLSARANGWVELSGIDCDGDRPMLEIGDVLVPPHGIQIATAYDDSYNQTPARLLRNIRGLGYRDEVLHYVGMSHFFRLFPQADGRLLVQPIKALCTPAEAWHDNFFAGCAALGYRAIASISFEVLAQHCPDEWQQRAHDGTPGRTGWDPPSALISPSQATGNLFLRLATERFAELLEGAGLPVAVQMGEPWWWLTKDYAPCMYDDSARAAFSGGTEEIVDLRAPLSAGQIAVLGQAGSSLASATSAIRDHLAANQATDFEFYLLAFTPTILDPHAAELPRLNVPEGWAYPAFDRLQLEDYDWLTAGAEALRKQAYAAMQDRLGYPPESQDYMAGFVLRAEDAERLWPLIDAGLDEAEQRGVPRRFVWALPQVCRDGYTRLPASQDDDMQAFDDVLYPLALGRDTAVSPEFSTSISVTASGHERRNSHWTDARLRFDVGPGIRSDQELGVLIEFFRARRGAARGFRLSDPFDFSSRQMTATPTMLDQAIGRGDGLTATFQLCKSYGAGTEPQVRPITRPRAETVKVSVDGELATGWTLSSGGRIVFADAPADGAVIRAGFLFDVPVRFAEDRLDITGAAFAAGEAPSVPLIEVREVV